MTPPVESRIDFDEQIERIPLELSRTKFLTDHDFQKAARKKIQVFLKDALQCVEEQTIQRMIGYYDQVLQTDDGVQIKRLYSTAQDGGKG